MDEKNAVNTDKNIAECSTMMWLKEKFLAVPRKIQSMCSSIE